MRLTGKFMNAVTEEFEASELNEDQGYPGVTPQLLAKIKKAVKLASPNGAITWMSIASHPKTAQEFVDKVEAHFGKKL